jgi:5-methylthioribose kinase
VFIVKGNAGGTAVKQALPYVRLVGESWPLPLSRSHYEYLALTHQARLAPGWCLMCCTTTRRSRFVVMELLEPHIIMRKGLLPARSIPLCRGHRDLYGAHAVFLSDLALSAARKKEGIAAFAGNHALCKITEDLIFTDPYRVAEQNRWTQPWLDATAAAFRDDLDLHVAVSRLKLKFMAAPEALIHGDLHTGSIMVTDSSTIVIDPGIRVLRTDGFRSRRRHRQSPDGLSASAGHERSPGGRRLFEVWVLETIETSGRVSPASSSSSGARRLTATPTPAPVSGAAGAARLEAERQAYMARLFATPWDFRPQKSSAAFWPGAQCDFD